MERDRNKKWSVIVSECWVLFLLLLYTGATLQPFGVGWEMLPIIEGPTQILPCMWHVFQKWAPPAEACLSFLKTHVQCVSLLTLSLPASPTVLCGKPLRTGTWTQESLFLPQYPAHSRSAETLAELNPVASFQHRPIYCLPAEWSSRTIGVLSTCTVLRSNNCFAPWVPLLPQPSPGFAPGKFPRLLRGTHQHSGVCDRG